MKARLLTCFRWCLDLLMPFCLRDRRFRYGYGLLYNLIQLIRTAEYAAYFEDRAEYHARRDNAARKVKEALKLAQQQIDRLRG